MKRDRILGVETEHAVFFAPKEAEQGLPDTIESLPFRTPPFEVLQSVLFDCLLAGRKSAVSGGLKGGYFLENGGLVHLEIYFRRQADTPILEIATPECRSPLEVVTYCRAFDDILEETSRRSEEALAERGYDGRITFGKNNLDVQGTGFGSHENYLLYSRPRRSHQILYLLALPVVLVCLVPPFLLLTVLLGVPLILMAFALVGAKVIPPMQAWTLRLYRWVVRTDPWRLVTGLRAAYWIVTNAVLFPAVAVYSFTLRHLAYRPVLQQLSSFLVCRQIFAGAGSLNFKQGVYEISQRAELTRSIGEIVLFGKHKTFFDLKGFLYSPLEFFRERKKLTIAVGDSNLCDIPNFLKLGTTTLLMEMLEDGVSFADLRLQRPVASLKQVSRAGPWKELRLRSGKRITALGLAREFLRRAKEYHADRPDGRVGRHQILRLWEETLDGLGEGPQSLAGSLDWVAKKALLDKVLLPQGNWKSFFAWGQIFHLAGITQVSRSHTLEDLFRWATPVDRFRLRLLAARSKVDPSDFKLFRRLYFQLRKIDFRYHELSERGYQRSLEAEGPGSGPTTYG
jgi:proteasome accessory factor A